MTEREKQRKTLTGRVISTEMDKTVVVAVERRVHHRLYHKSMRRVHKFNAHDELNAYQVGDTVRLTETRPLSKTKRWRVSDLLHRDDVPEIRPSEITEQETFVTTETPEAVAEVEDSPAEEAPEAIAEVEAPAVEETPESVAEVEDSPVEEAPEAVAEEEEKK